ncbi:MAG: adenosine kinase, partial [Bdellovibrionales bacterium]|nr:adenosine kinase [Bdellovibrionales bacterium]
MSEKTYDVYGIGNAIIDLQLQVADADIQRFGMKKGAMQLVDTTAQKALLEHFHGQNLNQASGGSAANTMIAIAQLGGRAAYGCLVGDDSFGSFYLEEMAQLGIDVATAPLEDSMTGTCVILITPDAERTMNTHLGASAQFSAQHVHEPAIAAAEWLYVEGYLFASEEGRQAAKRAIALAKSHGTKVALTVSDGFIVEVFGRVLRTAVKSADLVFANLTEAQLFTGIEFSGAP